GEFRLGGIGPGHYAAFAMSSAEKNIYGEPAQFEITDHDVSGLELKVRAGASISGTLALEGVIDPDAQAKLSQVQIIGRTIPPSGQENIFSSFSSSKRTPDGGFLITGLCPGKVRLFVSLRSPKGFVISRIERNGVEMNDGIDLGPSETVTGVRVTLNYGNCIVHGQVKIEGGELPKNSIMYVRVHRPNDDTPLSY